MRTDPESDVSQWPMSVIGNEPQPAPVPTTSDVLHGISGDAGVLAPPPSQMLSSRMVAAGEVDRSTVFLVGCHGGAGVDTLAALIEGLTAHDQSWPAPEDRGTSADVLLVARDSRHGLDRALIALRQWKTAGAPENVHLLGIVLVAASSSKRTAARADVRIKRMLVAGLAPAVWHIDWHEELLSTSLDAVAQCRPAETQEVPARSGRRVKSLMQGTTSDVAALARATQSSRKDESVGADHLADQPVLSDRGPAVDHDEALFTPPVATSELGISGDDDEGALELIDDQNQDQVITDRFPAIAGPIATESPRVETDQAIDGARIETGPAPATISQPSAWPVQDFIPASGTRRGHRSLMITGVSCAVALLITLGALATLGLSRTSDSEPDRSAMDSFLPSPSSSMAAADPQNTCPAGVNGSVTTGNGPGDQTSGPGVIQAFQWAYYVSRDAAEAKAVTASSAALSVNEMQEFIDQRPAGTTHCLVMTDQGSGLYAVQLTESPPEGSPIVYSQLIQTTNSGGRTWIASIRKAD